MVGLAMNNMTGDIAITATLIGLFVVLLFAVIAGGASILTHSRSLEVGRDNWKAMVDNLQEQLDKQTSIINDLQQSNSDMSGQIVVLEKANNDRVREIGELNSLTKEQGNEITELQALLQSALETLKQFISWSNEPHGTPPQVSEQLQGKINAL